MHKSSLYTKQLSKMWMNILHIEIVIICSFVLSSYCTNVHNCQSSGMIKEFPHCIGYWPPNYNPSVINITNTKDDIYNHTIQVSILLPADYNSKEVIKRGNISEKLAPAQKRSGVGTLIGFQTIRDKNLIRDDIIFNITLRDSKCDETYGLKAFLEAYSDEVHVLFGPSCDYSLGREYM